MSNNTIRPLCIFALFNTDHDIDLCNKPNALVHLTCTPGLKDSPLSIHLQHKVCRRYQYNAANGGKAPGKNIGCNAVTCKGKHINVKIDVITGSIYLDGLEKAAFKLELTKFQMVHDGINYCEEKEIKKQREECVDLQALCVFSFFCKSKSHNPAGCKMPVHLQRKYARDANYAQLVKKELKRICARYQFKDLTPAKDSCCRDKCRFNGVHAKAEVDVNTGYVYLDGVKRSELKLDLYMLEFERKPAPQVVEEETTVSLQSSRSCSTETDYSQPRIDTTPLEVSDEEQEAEQSLNRALSFLNDEDGTYTVPQADMFDHVCLVHLQSVVTGIPCTNKHPKHVKGTHIDPKHWGELQNYEVCPEYHLALNPRVVEKCVRPVEVDQINHICYCSSGSHFKIGINKEKTRLQVINPFFHDEVLLEIIV